MILFIKSLWYFARHPFDVVQLTVVRRYADAQGHYIGELYDDNGRSARMIGVSCDNLALDSKAAASSVLRWNEEFTAPMKANTLRVGGQVPEVNAHVWEYVALRRFCTVRIAILNRFVEYILEGNNAR